MSSNEIIGAVVVALGSILSLIIVIAKPILELNASIVKLTTVMEHMVEDDKKQDKRLNSHSKQLDDHETRIIKLEK